MPDYQKGKIYTIRFHNNTSIYIGSTTQYISSRFHQHKQPQYQTSICKYVQNNPDVDWSLCYYELYENFPCNSKEELNKREGEVIRLFRSDNNYNVLNKCIAGRTKKEYKDENKEIDVNYRKINKEKIAERQKDYYSSNKDKIAERQKKYRDNNKEKIMEISRVYRDANKDKLAERDKQYRKGKENGFRACKTCGAQIEYIPRRVNCCSCYKKQTNWIKPSEEVNFIEDE